MHWEYWSVQLGPEHDPDENLNALGADGWELVSAFVVNGEYVQYVLKRPVPDDA